MTENETVNLARAARGARHGREILIATYRFRSYVLPRSGYSTVAEVKLTSEWIEAPKQGGNLLNRTNCLRAPDAGAMGFCFSSVQC